MSRVSRHPRAALRPTVVALFALALGATGCGGPTGPANALVKGRIQVKGGIPLSEGKLILIPEQPAPGQRPAGATIGTDGTFDCYATAGGAGIPPGSYKVLLSFPSGMGTANPLHTAFFRYTREDSTPLKLVVPPEGLTNVVLEVEEDSQSAAKEG
jgi:hypothetical protein